MDTVTEIGVTANTASTEEMETLIEKLEEESKQLEQLGQYKLYSNQLVIPEIEGARLVKHLYQISSETGKKVAENVYTHIPTAHLTLSTIAENMDKFGPYILSYLQETEDTLIKNDHRKGATQVFTEYLNLNKILNALEEKECGTRLNKEKIETWFTADIQDSLIILFSDKLGIDEESEQKEQDKLVKIIKAYKNKFASLAGGKTFIKEEDCEAMIKVIDSAGSQDTFIGSRLINRLNGMAQKETELLESL